MNQTIQTIAKQINAKELKFAKFKLAADETNNSVTVLKGKKYVVIKYNQARDLYVVDLGVIKNYTPEVKEILTDVYFDQLKSIIESHFPRFEYVMESIKIVGVNC